MAGHGELATEVRARLEVIERRVVMQKVPAKLDEIWFGRPKRQHVLEFGALFGVIFNLIAGYLLLVKNAPLDTPLALCICSVVLYSLSRLAPSILLPVWSGWMTFAHYLGLVMTTVILSAAWVIAFLPISLCLRVLRIKVMDVTFHQPVETYWENRDSKYDDFKLLERQF